MTRKLQLDLDVRNVQKETVEFLEEIIRSHQGQSSLRIIVSEPKNNLKANLVTLDSGIEINNELIQFLDNRPEIDVQVTLV